ncbi:hypothetical protein ACLKA6_001592 [Drosophila palustris]
MESNIEFAPNVHSTPVCTGTLDLQKIVDELKREFNVMKAERGRERVEMDALRQEVAELKSRVSALEAAREREAEEGGERGAITAREGLAEEERTEERELKGVYRIGHLPIWMTSFNSSAPSNLTTPCRTLYVF